MDKFIELFGEKLLSKDGEVSTKDAVANKTNVLVYFSAHWCPPCRGFTPQLAQAYKDCPVAGKDVMIVFASSDKDEDSFKSYYGEMPWHALPYSERELKNTLSGKFEVQGIPTLVVLDGSGNLVTKDGRAEFKKYLEGSAAPVSAASTGFDDIFGGKLTSKDGEVATKDAVAGKKHIMIYFSAHWCPPCRGFTPQLAKAYKDSPAAGKDVIVVFVSSDKDEASFNEYYGEMPWYALPFADRDTKGKLSEKYSVNGIPSLIVLDDKGKMVTANGRAEYTTFLGGGGAPGAAGDASEKKAACCAIS